LPDKHGGRHSPSIDSFSILAADEFTFAACANFLVDVHAGMVPLRGMLWLLAVLAAAGSACAQRE
jgi:hypothetical protein